MLFAAEFIKIFILIVKLHLKMGTCTSTFAKGKGSVKKQSLVTVVRKLLISRMTVFTTAIL